MAMLLASAAVAAQPPAGQPVATGERVAKQREMDELFQRALRDPGNAELTLRYAGVAIELGDYEAAVTALERILFFNPGLYRARLELGVLYYRLGSYGIARAYLEEARAAPDASPEAVALCDRYLAALDRLQSPHRFVGQASFGFQHQTDANLGPSSAEVRAAFAPGGTATLAPQFVKRADQNLFEAGSVLYSYALPDQDRTTLEATGQAYFSQHFRVRRFDLAYVEATAGPRSTLASLGAVGFTGRPYLIADYVRLGGEPFFHALGFGLEASQAFRPDLVGKAIYEFRDKRYANAADRPNTSDLSGNSNSMVLQLAYAPSEAQLVVGTFDFIDEATRADFQSYREYGVTLGYQIAYGAPLGLSEQPWQTALSAGYYFDDYESPNPQIDPTTGRQDRRWRLAVSQTVPVSEQVRLVVQVQDDIVDSSLPNFSYSNLSVTFGPQIQF
jgi:hypothetical protein